MPFLSSMRLGCCGLKSCSGGMGIFSQGLACWAERASVARVATAGAVPRRIRPATLLMSESLHCAPPFFARRLPAGAGSVSIQAAGSVGGDKHLVRDAANVGFGHLVHPSSWRNSSRQSP